MSYSPLACRMESSVSALIVGAVLCFFSFFRTVNECEEKPVRILRGHTDFVMTLVYSPDNKGLFSAGHDKTIRFWDVGSGKEQFVIDTNAPIFQLAITPDGKKLLSANDKQVCVWEIATKRKLASYTGGWPLLVSPDGKWFTSSGPQFCILGRDIETGKEKVAFRGHTDIVGGDAVFLPAGHSMISVGDHTARLWNTSTGELRRMLPHLNLVDSVGISPDGKTMAQTGIYQGKQLTIWDIESGKEVFTFEHDHRLFSVAFSSNGKAVAVGTDGAVLLIDPIRGTLLKTLKASSDGIVASVKFSPDDTTIAATSYDNSICIWKLIDALPEYFQTHQTQDGDRKK